MEKPLVGLVKAKHPSLLKNQQFFAHPKVARNFFEKIGKELQITKLEDWYNVGEKQIQKFPSARRILSSFEHLPAAFRAAYPEYHWEEWKFTRIPLGFWNLSMQRRFFESLGKKLSLINFESWYKIKYDDVIEYGGASLLVMPCYNSSVAAALKDAFPEHRWLPWKFLQVPKHYWDNEDNVRLALAHVENELEIKSIEDWNQIPRARLVTSGLATLLNSEGGIAEIIRKYRPSADWNEKHRLNPARQSKIQQLLFGYVQSMFPQMEIHNNYVLDQDEVEHRKLLEVDVFIPDLRIAFEYQGEQHYKALSYYLDSPSKRDADEQKKLKCANLGVTLIEIPYWWNNRKESVAATVLKHRPDVRAHLSKDVLVSLAKELYSAIPETPTFERGKESRLTSRRG